MFTLHSHYRGIFNINICPIKAIIIGFGYWMIAYTYAIQFLQYFPLLKVVKRTVSITNIQFKITI